MKGSTTPLRPLSRNALPYAGSASIAEGILAPPPRSTGSRPLQMMKNGTQIARSSGGGGRGGSSIAASKQVATGRRSTATPKNSKKRIGKTPLHLKKRRQAARPYAHIPITWNAGKGRIVPLARYV